ncbi:DEKNAAC100502 [Brettanomyces naardenensis]|uniref:DEKNAAC100502 n=1 Tax=Brettanomyces naardenensis TaxID=13370 RepID=A0A448YFG4_BRENA|nr:DEKNAAC100502 [Brettanomyces naardenensis]
MNKVNDETTPLQQDAEQYEEDWYDEYEDDTIMKNPYFRYGVYALAAVFGLPLIYFLIIYLPNEAPASEQIADIAVASKSPVYLHPVIPPSKHKSLGSEEYEHIEEENDEDDDIYWSGEYSADKKDPDDPIKKVPDFSKWAYLAKDSELFQEHAKKLKGYSSTSKATKRMILIGDIHGSLKPLQRLLRRVKFDNRNDQIVMLGDFLAKGKDSMGVLEWAVKNNAGCVLGNHEIEILKRYAQFHGLPKLTFVGRPGEKKNASRTIDIDEVYDLDDLMKIAKHLSPEHIRYLRECPLIQELGPVPHMTNRKQTKYFAYPAEGFAAHAGLLWNVKKVEDQDPVAVTTMRNLLPPDWTIPTEDRHEKVDGVKSEAWFKHWNAQQKKDESKEMKDITADSLTVGKKVYYGHDAGRGITIKPYSTGLDSGCVYGAALSTEIVWAEVVISKATGEPIIEYRHQFVQVNC